MIDASGAFRLLYETHWKVETADGVFCLYDLHLGEKKAEVLGLRLLNHLLTTKKTLAALA